MNNFNFSDCRKAVNQATFRPTAERKALALKLLQEAVEMVTNLEEVKESSKKTKTKKRRRKTTKRTPSQKVADRQEMANKTNEVGPITPSKKGPKKASVEEARKSAKAVSEASGAAAKAARKAELRKESETADKVASLEAKIEALTAVLAVHMETTSLPTPSNEVGLDQLPF